jgi:hypothetical protein
MVARFILIQKLWVVDTSLGGNMYVLEGFSWIRRLLYMSVVTIVLSKYYALEADS